MTRHRKTIGTEKTIVSFVVVMHVGTGVDFLQELPPAVLEWVLLLCYRLSAASARTLDGPRCICRVLSCSRTLNAACVVSVWREGLAAFDGRAFD